MKITHPKVVCCLQQTNRFLLGIITLAFLTFSAGTVSAGTELITKGSPVKILVPPNDDLGTSWVDPAFDDSTWLEGVSGVGYETGPGGYDAVIVADSVSEWSGAGRQGQSYWFNGYYNLTSDPNGIYNPESDFNTTDPNWNFIDGAWQLGVDGDPIANPPWDNIGQTSIHPNGINNTEEHWSIRRWISTYSGDVTILFHLRKNNGDNTGVTGKIFHNGLEVFSRAIAGSDTAGYTAFVHVTISMGDLLDFAQTPVGLNGDTGDGSDSSTLTARVIEGTIEAPVTEDCDTAASDTADDWGSAAQGENGWFYGYYSKTDDADGIYDPAVDFNNTDPNWTFTGGVWQLGTDGNPTANPPWSNIGQTDWHPNGDNNVKINWVIKRWISTLDGDIRAQVQFAKSNTGGGNGTTLRVIHNGLEVFAHTVAFNDGTGINTNVVILGVSTGDFIEFALDPVGTDGLAGDGSDGSRLRATIYPCAAPSPPVVPGLRGDIATDLENEMKGINSSAYLRFPFEVTDTSEIETLNLKLKYNDGAVIYLNGVEVDKRNATTEIMGVTAADSMADWPAADGILLNGWENGYYSLTADSDGVFQPADFTPFPTDGTTVRSDVNFWDGSSYDWFNGNPPWTFQGQEDSHPNGINNGAEHWSIRRWNANVDADFNVRFRFRKSNVNCGDGVTGKIFHNGVEIYSQHIDGTDGVGRDDTVAVPGVFIDDTIDFMVSPGPTDGCDGTFFSAVIFEGVPAVPWNGVAETARTAEETIAASNIDLTDSLSLLQVGQNVLAIHGVNISADDDTFLVVPELIANQLPVAGLDAVDATQPFATPYAISSLLANDTDPDGDIIVLVNVGSGDTTEGGTVAVMGNLIKYQPPPAFEGVDSFTYLITDGSGVPVTGTVEVTVAPDTTPPILAGGRARATLNQIVIEYSEPMNTDLAGDGFNYLFDDLTLFADTVNVNADGSVFILNLNQNLPLNDSVCLEISGMEDISGNLMEATYLCIPVTFSSCYALSELWYGLPGPTVPDLTNSPAYPDFPSHTRYRPMLESIVMQGDNYGVRLSGWLKPPTSGEYNFAMSADGAAEFWLSTDSSPANKVMVAFEPEWNGPRNWTGTDRRVDAAAPSNRSTTLFPAGISLVAGELYYFEAIMKEETGPDDHVSVTWQMPGEAEIANGVNLPIAGKYIYTLDQQVDTSLTLVQQPQDATAYLPPGDPSVAVFSVAAEATASEDIDAPIAYQWQRNDGGDWMDIPNATSAELSFEVAFEDEGAQFRSVVCYIQQEAQTSEAATLTVIPVNSAPSFTPGPDVSAYEIAGAVILEEWATDISPGRLDEADQAVWFEVSNDNPDLFADQPAISPDGALTFAPVAGMSGMATITTVLKDDGGTENGGQDASEPVNFMITVELIPTCPEAEDTLAMVPENGSVEISLSAFYPVPDQLRFWVISPSHGIVRGLLPNLVYTPQPGYCGNDTLLFLVDNGNCFSRGQVAIEVTPVNDCPIANPQWVSTCEEASVEITLAGSDPDEAGCGPAIQEFTIDQPPANGALSGTPPMVIYTPNENFSGVDTFTFIASDGDCSSEPATVSVEVKPVNDGPVCQIVVGPLLQLTSEVTENIVVACDNQSAEVVLDGTLSGDAENASLTYVWEVDGEMVGSDPIQSVMLELGTHEIVLTVDDGGAGTDGCPTASSTSTCRTTVTVIEGCEAIQEVTMMVEQTTLLPQLKTALIKHLNLACDSFSQGNCTWGVLYLAVFSDKVNYFDVMTKQNAAQNPAATPWINAETAEQLMNAAGAIADSYGDCECPQPQPQ